MTQPLFDEMKAYVGFGPTEEAALRALGGRVDSYLPGIVTRFYDRIDDDDNARAVVEAHSSRTRLSGQLVVWLQQFLAGPWDAAYYARRLRIGKRHVSIGLRPHYVFTAMSVLREGLLQHASADETLAVNRLIDVELAIVSNTYWEHIGAQLQRRERMATIGELAGSFAHEVRNPLSALQNAAWFLSKQVDPAGDARVARHLDVMSTKVEECGRLVDTLLEFSSARAPRRDPVSLATLISEVIGEIEHPDTVQIVPPEPGDWVVTADAMQLRALLRNLVRNAVQALDDTPGVVEIRAAVDGDRWRLEVVDDGPGIAAHRHTEIFRPLVTSKTYGLGLGLAYCRRVAVAHGGDLWVESEPGAGARFIVEGG